MALVPFYEGGASDAQEGSPTYEGDASVQYPYSDPSWQAISSVEEGSWNQGLTEWHPQKFSKQIDPATGYFYYENITTGERHWDRPLDVVLPLQPKSPSRDDEVVNEARIKRQRVEKDTRRKHMIKRREIFDKQLLEERSCADATEGDRVQAVWDEAERHAAEKGGDLSIAWQHVPGVSEKHVFGFDGRNYGMKLVSLRLVGLGLEEVPTGFGEHMLSLRSLSFSSNILQEIPDDICNLTGLTDLNLIRNRLGMLPDRFGNLLRLKKLSIAGNRLEAIPASFGNLVRLKRVVLDCNCLRRLPETLGRMKCKLLNVSNNKLAGLPRCIKEMPRLAVFSAVNNGLRFLPPDIGESRSITALHLASNQLNQLPDSICRLKTLKVLWLDHNNIAGLPMNFHELKGLEKLMLEHNDMVYPPNEVVLDGCDRVRKWCFRRMHDRISARQHTIVMSVQNILKQIAARGLGDPSCFEADVEVIEKKGDHFYGLIYERFWDTMLPALEKEWETGVAATRGAFTSFGYSRDEVDQVLLDYRDPNGRVLLTRTQMFRRCACRSPNGHRRVCVPPKVGWMCERKATLIKHDIILERENEERRRQDLEVKDIEFRVSLARRLIKDGSETIEGKKTYKRKAIKMAEALKKKKELGKFQTGADVMKMHRTQKVEKKFSKLKEALAKERQHRLADLQLKVAAMEEELKTLRGWGKEQKEEQIGQILRSMEALPEDAKMTTLQEQLEKEVKIMEEKATTEAAQKTQKVAMKKVKRGDREFQELVDEMIADLVQQDMDVAGEKARKKAGKEHEVFRRIMAMWVGLGMRESFAEWKMWTKKRIRQRRRDTRRALREAWHEYEAEGVVGVMADWKMSFWEERFDVYTDSRYWIHKETGKVQSERPTVERFIPEGYTIPKPPLKRLEDMSSSDSSGSASGSGSRGSSGSSGSLDGSNNEESSRSDRSSRDDDSTASSDTSGDDVGLRSGLDDRQLFSACGTELIVVSPEASEQDDSNTESMGSGRSDDDSSGSDVSESGSSRSGSRSGSQSASDEESTNGSGSGKDGSTSAGSRPDSQLLLMATESRRVGVAPPTDGREASTTATRATTETTVTTSSGGAEREEIARKELSAESIALQLASGEKTSGRPPRGKAGGDVVRFEGTVTSSFTPPEENLGKREEERPKSSGVVEFIIEKTSEVKQVALDLLKGNPSESTSSVSSLRSAKSLERQKEWEVDHARVRARHLRETTVQRFKDEEKVHKKTAAMEARQLHPKKEYKTSVDDVISTVGWDSNAKYTSNELDAFAKKALKKMAELGRSESVELAKYSNKLR